MPPITLSELVSAPIRYGYGGEYEDAVQIAFVVVFLVGFKSRLVHVQATLIRLLHPDCSHMVPMWLLMADAAAGALRAAFEQSQHSAMDLGLSDANGQSQSKMTASLSILFYGHLF